MKKSLTIIFCFLSVLAMLNSDGQDATAISQYKPLDYTGMVKILVRLPTPGVYDSVYFKNGVAHYQQDKYDGEVGWIYITDVDRNMVHYIILEKGTIKITATSDSLIFVTGTPNNDALFTLDRKIEPLRMKMKVLGREVARLRAAGENEKADKVQSDITAIGTIWWDEQTKFAVNNSNMAGLAYVNKLASRFNTTELRKILENYRSFANKNAYKAVQRRYAAELLTDVGIAPPAFRLVSDQGQMVALSDVKRKLTIIDFWASWCKPCRAENPNMISLYEKWKSNGLEIISISIDKPEDKGKWLEAIKEDKITWVQLWDEKGETNKAYGITAIPRTFLVDDKGIIVHKDLRGDALNKAVEAYFASPAASAK